jgi:membrane associated rhomboid family serine protease
MIPLRDNNPTKSFPFVTILLIAANIFVYFSQLNPDKSYFEMVPRSVVTEQPISGVVTQQSDGSTRFIPVPADQLPTSDPTGQIENVVEPTLQPAWLTIFTAMFLHANFLHIAGNMLFLWIFGNNVEDAFGKMKFLIFYVFCGFMAAIAQIAIGPDSVIPTLGASGAIAGVLGAYIVMYPDAKVLTLFTVGLIFLREISAFWVLGIWIVIQVFEGFTSLTGPQQGGVAFFAHIGGFLVGLLITVLIGGRDLAAKQRVYSRYNQTNY